MFNAEKTNGEAIIRGIHIPDPRLVTELRNINDANLNDRFQKLEQFRTAHWEEIRKDPASRKELMIKELRTISYVTNLALRKEKYDLFNTNYGLYAKEIGNIVRRVKVEEVTI
ncbi:MAG: hypothetical protein LBC61_04830 [Candidatus Peribacteria bacterium]|nr:hypothetical protein [Candidatus Peribacteria bacterium]